jgi:hypothetical protein
MPDAAGLRCALRDAAPKLWAALDGVAAVCLKPLVDRLSSSSTSKGLPKTFNDPIWGVIELMPWEVALVDTPLLQRLRGIRQLGMAHLVYPGAGYDRLEHTLGAVEAASRMVEALQRNALHRRTLGGEVAEQDIPTPSDDDIRATRLGALLHDIGHGPYSHATEPFVEARYEAELVQVRALLRAAFEGAGNIAAGEALSVLLIMSEPMRTVLEHGRLAPYDGDRANLPLAVAARVLGSRAHLYATYLSGVVSGPLDADKLDYMARDSYHSGFPVGLDTNRLISKLEVVTVTPGNVPAAYPDLKRRAEAAPGRRFFEIGISIAGLGAYEQMIVARVLLYDRLYYHHKIRAAEAMVRELIRSAEQESARELTITEHLSPLSDEAVLWVLSGVLKSPLLPSGTERSLDIGTRLTQRVIHHRAYAIAARFIKNVEGLPPEEAKQTRIELWNDLVSSLDSIPDCDRLAERIFDVAAQLGGIVGDLKAEADGLRREHVIVDFPRAKAVVRGNDLLTRTESGQVNTPNLFFNPERWSEAYEQQKRSGYVFARRESCRLVNLAAKLVLYDKFGIVMEPEADHAAKMFDAPKHEWAVAAAAAGACSSDAARDLFQRGPLPLTTIRDADLVLPEQLLKEDAALRGQIAADLKMLLPGGLPASSKDALVNGIGWMANFLVYAAREGLFVKNEQLDEVRDLQAEQRKYLRALGVDFKEAPRLAGGITDLVLPGDFVLENKVFHQPTEDVFGEKENFGWQVRRYSMAASHRLGFICIAYKPRTDAQILPLAKSIRVLRQRQAPEAYVTIRIVIPWGHDVPSRAKGAKEASPGAKPPEVKA